MAYTLLILSLVLVQAGLTCVTVHCLLGKLCRNKQLDWSPD